MLLTVLLFSGCELPGSAETANPVGADGKIVVASHLAYPPFEYSRGGEPRGFDIELMDEIAKRLDSEVEYRDVPFDGITQGLAVGDFDAAISAMTVTGVREQQVDFSDPYYEVSEVLVVRGGSLAESPEDLAGKAIGVRPGATERPGVGEFVESLGAAQIRIFPTAEEAFAALRDGSVDGVIADLPVSQAAVEKSGGALKVGEVIPTGEHYGIAFPKGSDLVEPVNEALAQIEEDGTYAEIHERWIGRPPEGSP